MMAKDGLFCRVVFFGLIIANTAGAQVWTEYLGGKDIKTIVWDSERRLIWFATYGSGVIAFDGANFVEYNTITTNGELINDTLTCAVIDYDFDLWFGTEEQGLIRFKPDSSRWQTYTTKHGLLPGRINTLAVDVQDGSIWIGTDGFGVNNFNRYSRWDTINTSRGLSSNDVYSIATDQQGNKWFGTNQAGVSRRDSSGHWVDYLKNERSIIYSIFVDTLGGDLNLYFGTEDGVYRLFPKTGQFDGRIRKDSPLAGRSVESIIADENGYKWFGYSLGAARLDLAEPDSIWKLYNDATTLGYRKVVTMARDGDDNLWFGADYLQQGTVKVTSNWLTFDERDGLASSAVLALAEDNNRTIWAGTSNGLSKLISTRWESFISYVSIPITAIAVDSANGLWLGTSGYGLVYIPPGVSPDDFSQVKVYPESPSNEGPISKFVHAISISSHDVWIATAAGLSRFQPDADKWESFKRADGLIDNQVNAVTVDSNIVWCGTVGGVSRFDTKTKTWRNFIKENGLAGNWVTAILNEGKNKIWFATKNGVSFYNNGIWEKPITVSNGLADNNVNALLRSKNPAGIWFGTINGASFRDSTRIWTTVRTPEGLGGDHVVALLQDSRNHIWFGTSLQGVTRYKRKLNPPEIELNSRLDIISSSELTYEFGGKDIGTPTNLLRYAYKVDGENYSPWTFDRFARLTILKDGLHTFFVKTIDSDGNESAEATDTFYKITLETGVSTSFNYSNLSSGVESLEIKLTWPPNLFIRDPQITIKPDTSNSLDRLTLFAFDITSEDTGLHVFKKPTTLTISYRLKANSPPKALGIYQEQPKRVKFGGTPRNNGEISTAIREFGRYSLREVSEQDTSFAQSEFTATAQPRVFSPSGRGHGPQTTISFKLDKSEHVRIQVYNLAGRLVDMIWNEQMSAGINAVPWNGKDRTGANCPTGLYIITIESRGFQSPPKPVKVMVLNE